MAQLKEAILCLIWGLLFYSRALLVQDYIIFKCKKSTYTSTMSFYATAPL